MVVNRWPTEFVYASRRILGDIVSQHEASRNNPFRLGRLKGGFAGFGAEAERRPAENNEIYALIRRATGYIRDYIGTLDDPELAPYVRAKVHLFSRRVRLWAVWEQKYHHEIATFTATETLPGIGRVLLTLVGSGSNFIARPHGLQSSAVRTPSDVFGLYDIVNECVEATDDPTLYPDVLRREQEREGSENEEWFKDVANIVLGESSTVPMELVDVLFKPHRVLYDADLRLLTSGPDHYAVAVIGTPLWIAKSLTEDDLVLPSRLRRYQADTVPSIPSWQPPAITQIPQFATAEEASGIEGPALAEPPGQLPVRIPLAAPPIDANRTWKSFDAQLEDLLRTDPQDEEISIASPAVADEEWDEFCHWFVDQASRFGGPPAALPTGGPWASHNRKGPMYPRYYGWVVPFNDDEALIMFADGHCRLATHRRKTTYRVTELKSGLREIAFRTLFLQVRYWWLVPGGSIRPLPPSTSPVYPRARRPRRRWPIWKWLEQQKHQDPFTTKLDLEPFRPFAYSHDEAVHFRNHFGTHWLVLDSVYASQQGVTVHIVRPADLDILDGLGGGMDNFAEDLAKAIRERDTKAIALFSHWPDNPPDINVIRRLIFTRAEEKLSIFEELRRLLSHTGEPPRYRHTDFYHYGFDDVSNMLRTPVPRETPVEVAARANRLPDWATLESRARKANDERP